MRHFVLSNIYICRVKKDSWISFWIRYCDDDLNKKQWFVVYYETEPIRRNLCVAQCVRFEFFPFSSKNLLVTYREKKSFSRLIYKNFIIVKTKIYIYQSFSNKTNKSYEKISSHHKLLFSTILLEDQSGRLLLLDKKKNKSIILVTSWNKLSTSLIVPKS